MARVGIPSVNTVRAPSSSPPVVFMPRGEVYLATTEVTGYQPGGSQPGGEQPAGSSMACALHASYDGGDTWVEVGPVTNPTFAVHSSGTSGVAFGSRSSTKVWTVFGRWLGTGGAPANDTRIEIWEFDVTTGTWALIVSDGAWSAAVESAPGSPSPIVAVTTSAGAIVVAYVVDVGGVKRARARVWAASGPWTSEVSLGAPDGYLPVAIAADGGGNAHVALWSPSTGAVGFVGVSSAGTVGSYAGSVLDLTLPNAASAPSYWPAGGATSASVPGQGTAFSFLHGLTATRRGVLCAAAADGLSPSWLHGQVIPPADATTFGADGGGNGYAGPLVVRSLSRVYAVWSVGGSIAYSSAASVGGVWSAPSLHGIGQITGAIDGSVCDEGVNLSGVEIGGSGHVLVVGDGHDVLNSCRLAWSRPLGLARAQSGSGAFSWFG